MSDGGASWQPPQPGSTPPPPPAASPGPVAGFAPPSATQPVPTSPTHMTQVPVESSQPPRRRRTGVIVAAAVGAVAIVGAGTFAVARISNDASTGGAASPEDAANALLDAIDQEDVLAMADLLLPGERTTLRDPAVDLVDELRRLEILSDGATLSKVDGVDLVVTDRSVTAEPTNVDDIVNVRIGASVAGSLDGEELPVGGWLEEITDTDYSEIQEEAEEPDPAEFEVTAVEEDGRWYLSIFYTAAEAMRKSAGSPDIPAEGVAPKGGDAPEGAMDALLDAVEHGDLEALIAGLDPNEMQALQRYAPLFLDDAQSALDEAMDDVAGLEYSITDREYRVEGSGDRRSVFIEGFTITATADGETATAAFHDGCLVVEADADSFDSCDVLGETPDLGDVVDDPQPLEDLIASVEDAFADYEAPGIIVDRVDGQWFVSPMATVSENILAVVRALTREEIEDLQTKVTDAMDVLDDVFVDLGEEFPQLDDLDLPVAEDFELPADDTTATDDSLVASDPTEDCYREDDPSEAASCFESLVAAGDISEQASPFYFRFPECGLAESMWSGEYYSLDDDEFVELVESSAPCFQAHVAAGDLEDYELAPELAKPECLAGRNPYSSTDDDYLQAFDECTAS